MSTAALGIPKPIGTVSSSPLVQQLGHESQYSPHLLPRLVVHAVLSTLPITKWYLSTQVTTISLRAQIFAVKVPIIPHHKCVITCNQNSIPLAAKYTII